MTELIAEMFSDLPFSEYIELDAVNNSSLKAMGTSPLHYHTLENRPRKDTPALAIGRPIHTAVLEPKKFFESVAVWMGGLTKDGRTSFSKNTSAYKSFAKEAAERGKEVLAPDQVAICQSVSDAVSGHPVAAELLSGGAPEVTIVWEHPTIGIKCKVRIDYLKADSWTDLKSAVDITPDGFGRAAHRFGYHVQGAFYQDAIFALTGKRLPFHIVAVEKQAPFDVAVYEVPDVALDLGRAIYEDRLLKVARCRETGVWPGVAPVAQTLELPNWAYEEQLFALRAPPDSEKGDPRAL